MFDLTGKTALVTGGSRGLGLSVAENFHKQGAQVVILSRSQKCKEVASRLCGDGGAPVYGVCCDLSVRENIEPAFSKALDLLGGRLDILVNNAGIQRNHTCTDFPVEYWDDVMKVNGDAVFLLTQLAGKHMVSNRYGRIINFASMLSFGGGRLSLAYAFSKGGIAQITKAYSNEWAQYGVTVNAIAPGFMFTDMNEKMFSDLSKSGHLLTRIPVGRWGKAEDIGPAAVFLASDEAAYVSGIVLPIDGGFLAW